MATDNSSSKDSTATDTTPHLGDARPDLWDRHRIKINYEIDHTDKLMINKGGEVNRIHDHEGVIRDQSMSFECICGQEFDTEQTAKRHLKQVFRKYQLPLADVPRSPRWDSKQTTICDGFVSGYLSTANHLLKVEDGADYLVATARTSFTPPERFDFDGWLPLEDGPMTFQDGHPQFRTRTLRQALSELVESASYRPDRYTIWYRGNRPLYLEGPAGGIVASPAQR